MAADCDCCAAGWLSVAKTFLEKRCNPTDDEVTVILAGHLCHPPPMRTLSAP
jgi:aerobic-type carbon monoxide dehydrogenase small subunit (CoxS/CutS family)